MLSVAALNVFYGESHVVRDVSFDVQDGETLAIMGRNGMGKTTLLKSLIGILRSRSGTIALSGRDVSAADSSSASPRAWAMCPRGG